MRQQFVGGVNKEFNVLLSSLNPGAETDVKGFARIHVHVRIRLVLTRVSILFVWTLYRHVGTEPLSSPPLP